MHMSTTTVMIVASCGHLMLSKNFQNNFCADHSDATATSLAPRRRQRSVVLTRQKSFASTKRRR